MSILHDLFFGGEKELHDDSSVTERFDDGTSITQNSDGTTREYTTHEVAMFGFGDKITVTHDGEGNTINVQTGWGKGK